MAICNYCGVKTGVICVSCLEEHVEECMGHEQIERLGAENRKLRARVEKAETALARLEGLHGKSITMSQDMGTLVLKRQVEIKKLRAALFCKEPECCKGTIGIERRVSDYGVIHYNFTPCPTCGPLREELRGEG